MTPGPDLGPGRRNRALRLTTAIGLAGVLFGLPAMSASAAVISGEVTRTNVTSTTNLRAWNPLSANSAVGTYLNGSGGVGDLWSGGATTTPVVSNTDPNGTYHIMGARLQAADIPATCDGTTANIRVTLAANNQGPNPGAGADTAVGLYNANTGALITRDQSLDTAVGVTHRYVLTASVPVSLLRANALAFTAVTESNHGETELHSPKRWRLYGFDVTYTLADESCLQEAALVDDADSTPVDTPVTVDLQANDTIPDGSTGWEVDTTTAQGGTVVDNGDGTVTYTPPAGFIGTDTFTYRVTGPDGVEVEATVTITVTEEDEPPVPMVAPGMAAATLLGAGLYSAVRRRRTA